MREEGEGKSCQKTFCDEVGCVKLYEKTFTDIQKMGKVWRELQYSFH